MIGHVRRIVLVAGKKRDYRQTRARAEKPASDRLAVERGSGKDKEVVEMRSQIGIQGRADSTRWWTGYGMKVKEKSQA